MNRRSFLKRGSAVSAALMLPGAAVATRASGQAPAPAAPLVGANYTAKFTKPLPRPPRINLTGAITTAAINAEQFSQQVLEGYPKTKLYGYGNLLGRPTWPGPTIVAMKNRTTARAVAQQPPARHRDRRGRAPAADRQVAGEGDADQGAARRQHSHGAASARLPRRMGERRAPGGVVHPALDATRRLLAQAPLRVREHAARRDALVPRPHDRHHAPEHLRGPGGHVPAAGRPRAHPRAQPRAARRHARDRADHSGPVLHRRRTAPAADRDQPRQRHHRVAVRGLHLRQRPAVAVPRGRAAQVPLPVRQRLGRAHLQPRARQPGRIVPVRWHGARAHAQGGASASGSRSRRGSATTS